MHELNSYYKNGLKDLLLKTGACIYSAFLPVIAFLKLIKIINN